MRHVRRTADTTSVRCSWACEHVAAHSAQAHFSFSSHSLTAAAQMRNVAIICIALSPYFCKLIPGRLFFSYPVFKGEIK